MKFDEFYKIAKEQRIKMAPFLPRIGILTGIMATRMDVSRGRNF